MGGHETGGLEQNWGLCPRPGPKTATAAGADALAERQSNRHSGESLITKQHREHC